MSISRQAYYKRIRVSQQRERQAHRVLDFVRKVRLQQPRLGTRKLHWLMQREADITLQTGRDRLFNILRHHRELVPRKRAYHKTTHSHHRFRRQLKAGQAQVVAAAPEQVWVADITYLPTRSGFAYLSLVTDAYSRKIVGHHVHETRHTGSVIRAMSKALKTRGTDQSLVHHYDRGVQYCSEAYQKLHQKHGVRCSMTDGYDCYHNALAER